MIDVVIVGAGVSGLCAAHVCQKNGLTIRVLEAQPKIGGRVQSVFNATTKGYVGDLGPTWLWPPYQPVAARWLSALKINTAEQFNDGNGLIEQRQGTPPIAQPLPSQHGMLRLAGGTGALVDALYKLLDADCVSLNAESTRIDFTDAHATVHATVEGAEKAYNSNHVIICTPLRVAAQSIEFAPALPDKLTVQLSVAPTWMAAQAKVLIEYEKPFWRAAGLSGRIASQIGPMVEAHDNSATDDSSASIFGFIGVPPDVRAAHRADLEQAVMDQLVRCFGKQATAPVSVTIEDWAQNRFICTEQDSRGPGYHPDVLPELIRQPHMDNRLQFAVAETSSVSPGLLEGALHAGESAALRIVNSN